MFELLLLLAGLGTAWAAGGLRGGNRARREESQGRPAWMPDPTDGAAIASWLRTNPADERVIALEYELTRRGDADAAQAVRDWRIRRNATPTPTGGPTP